MHGFTQGVITGVSGGSFDQGFWSAAISSVVSTFVQTGGVKVFGSGDVATVLYGTASGGLGAELTGGNFWQGAATGLVVSGLNHVAHRMTEPMVLSSSSEEGIVPSGEIEFKRLTKEQLDEFRVIPEDVSEETPIYAPDKNGIYKGDGFYHKDFSDEKYWYKVSAGGKVTVTYSNKTGYNL